MNLILERINKNFIMDVKQAIIDIEHFNKTHIDWAEYFEKNPEKEKEYLETGEWSSAKEHREIVSKYGNVLKILEAVHSNTSDESKVLHIPCVSGSVLKCRAKQKEYDRCVQTLKRKCFDCEHYR
jgi:hypothetical protein